MKLDQAEFIDMSSLSRHSTFNVAAQGARKSSNNLFCRWSETQTKRWTTASELQVLDLSLFNVEEDSKAQGDQNVRMNLPFKTYLPILEGSRRHSFHHECEKYICERSPRILQEFYNGFSLQDRSYSVNWGHRFGKPNCSESNWIFVWYRLNN